VGGLALVVVHEEVVPVVLVVGATVRGAVEGAAVVEADGVVGVVTEVVEEAIVLVDGVLAVVGVWQAGIVPVVSKLPAPSLEVTVTRHACAFDMSEFGIVWL